MLNAEKIRQLEAELRGYLDQALAGKPTHPVFPTYNAHQPDDLPSDGLLDLLGPLKRIQRRCPGNTKSFAYAWNNAMRLRNALALFGWDVRGKRILEAGSGVYNPLGASIVLLAMGAERCASFDAYPPENPEEAARAALQTYTETCMLFPAEAPRLAQALNTHFLAEGMLPEAQDGYLLNHAVSCASVYTECGPFDIIHSNAVLEHFMDFDACLARLSDLTVDGGMHLHKVDFIDHAHYDADPQTEMTPFEFLCTEDPDGLLDTNRIRYRQLIERFWQHGFRMLKVVERWTKPFPPTECGRLAQPYQGLSHEDLETVCATMLFRKERPTAWTPPPDFMPDEERFATDLTVDQAEAIRNALLATYAKNMDPAYLTSEAGRRDIEDHVNTRYTEGRNCYLPWLEHHFDLAGKTVLEIGCGTGSSAVAFARRAERVIAYDIDGNSVDAARERCRIMEIDNAEFHTAPAETLCNLVASRHATGVDVVLLSAVLEHCTLEERLLYLRTCWGLLKPGGVMVVTETPNRLYHFDYHTSFLPFFNALPDELARLYAERSPREDFVRRVARDQTPEDARESLTRYGRGVSYHEFELAMGDLDGLIIADGWDAEVLRFRPLQPAEEKLKETVETAGYGIHPGFLRRDIDLVFRRPMQ
jgi:2-polyprenyl-3-methyl-5-hydroxy-6-metoxy-1,4-benzoquinol methylase